MDCESLRDPEAHEFAQGNDWERVQGGNATCRNFLQVMKKNFVNLLLHRAAAISHFSARFAGLAAVRNEGDKGVGNPHNGRKKNGRKMERPPGRRRILAGLLSVGVLLGGLTFAFKAGAAAIWVGAEPPEWRAVRGWGPSNYMDLFTPGAPWNRVAAATQAFFLTEWFVLRAPDADLARVIAGLKERHIAIAMQLVPLVARSTCGRAVESYGSPRDAMAAALRIRRLGGVLAYARMDEPLWFGHAFAGLAGRVGCRMPIAEVAAEAATKIAQLEEIFPAIQVGDSEPFGVPLPDRIWAQDLAEWFTAYRVAVGRPLAFFHADCVWPRRNWQDQFLRGVRAVRAAGIPLGVIYDGAQRDDTDLSWTDAAIAHYRLVEGTLGIHPDAAIFQSWTDRPRRVLPENQPGTLTNVVASYLAWHAAAK